MLAEFIVICILHDYHGIAVATVFTLFAVVAVVEVVVVPTLNFFFKINFDTEREYEFLRIRPRPPSGRERRQVTWHRLAAWRHHHDKDQKTQATRDSFRGCGESGGDHLAPRMA